MQIDRQKLQRIRHTNSVKRRTHNDSKLDVKHRHAPNYWLWLASFLSIDSCRLSHNCNAF